MYKVKITSKYDTPYIGYYYINHLNPFELYYISGFYVNHYKSDYNDFEPYSVIYYKIIKVSKEGEYIGYHLDTASHIIDDWWQNSKYFCFNKNLKRLLKKQRYKYYLLYKEDYNIYKGQLVPYCRSFPYKNPAFQLVYQVIPHHRTQELLKLKNRFKT